MNPDHPSDTLETPAERYRHVALVPEDGGVAASRAAAPGVLDLPTDHSRGTARDSRGAVVDFAVPAVTVRGLRALARREEAPLHAVLLAGWQVLLARWSGQEEVAVGSRVAGTAGSSDRMPVLRTDLRGDPALCEAVAWVREAFQDLRSEPLAERSAPGSQVSFALRDGAEAGEPLGSGGAELALEMSEDGDAVAGTLHYRAELWDAGTMARVVERFLAVLDMLAADPERRLSGLELLGWREREQLDAWSRAAGAERGAARVYVLDRWGQPTPPGAAGDLYLGGMEPAPGADRPETAAASLVPDPFAGEAGARMRRTGERARWRADGSLELVGRTEEPLPAPAAAPVPEPEPVALEPAAPARPALTPERRLLLQKILQNKAEERRQAEEIRRAPRDRPLPLSFAQQRLWFIDQLEPGNPAYNIPAPLTLRGGVDVRALRRTLTGIVSRHESLRTVFDEVEGEPAQVVRPPAPVPLPVVDLGGVGEEARRREVERLAREDAAAPFDLRRGPLFRAALVREGGDAWALLLTMHHIVSDGWSIGVLVNEFSALYGAFSRGLPSPLPEPRVQYGDFAAWQRGWLAGGRLEAQLAYWRGRLAGAPPTLDLPTDHPRPAVPGLRGDAHAFELSPAVSQAVRELCRREGITPYMAFLAAWQLLLARYAGADDVSVGTAIAGRNRLELEGLVGFFVNTLVLRTELSGRPTVRETLRRVREATLDAFASQDVPFERLVEELAPERSLQHAPLFQVMFTYQNNDLGRMDVGALELDSLDHSTEAAKFDLSLTAWENEDDGVFGGNLVYRADLFEPATLERMEAHLSALLEGLAGDPERAAAALPLMDAAERAGVLAAAAGPAREYPREACIHDLFRARAARAPDAVALSWDGGELSYAALDRRSDRLADALLRRGVARGTRVGVFLERGPEWIASLLAVLKAGAVYVPLDPASPAERTRYLLEDSGAALVLTAEGLRGQVPEFGGETVVLDGAGDEDAAAGCSLFPLPCSLSSDDLAYVIYTSGSTGRPKGTLIRHGGVVNYLAFLAEEYGLGPGDAVLQMATPTFDASVRETLGPLVAGARLVLSPAGELADPRRLLERVRERGVTAIMAVVPSVLRPVLAEARPGEAALRLLLVSGEPLPVADARRAREVFGAGLRVVNQWGATECTMSSTLHTVADDEATPIAPVGVPIHNTRVYVLDPELEPVPPGVPGEAYIATPGLAHGYGGRPGLTAEKFVADPFAAEPGARMYRVGDRVRRRRDGVLEFLGRVDQQVKVQGVRVEPGEVEAVLRAHPAVAAAAVLAREERSGEARLVAYVVAADGADPSAAELRAYLAEGLPPYMVPGAWVALDALPLLPNGKLDRRALPDPDDAAPRAEYAAPATPTETGLAAIWAEVLGVERVGATDDFFALGGHSLLATRMISRVRRAFRTELPLRALFEAPTLRGIAARIDAALGAGEGTDAPPILPVPRDRPLPLSFAQQRIWFLQALEPGSAAYNMPHPLRLEGALDVPALRRSLDALAARHETLRTVFGRAEGGPVQTVLPAAPVALPAVDVSGLSADDRARETRRLVAAEAMRPFDLARGPLMRALLVRAGEEEHGVLFTLHHVIADGWSLGILVREVSELYSALAAGREPRLPGLPVQYADYAVWQREWLSGGAMERQVAFWRERLGGAPPLLELPTDRPRPAVATEAGARVGFELGAELSGALDALSRAEGATLFMTLMAAFQALLGRWSGQDDVLVGTPIAGRTRAETEGLIGMFVNTLVLRTRLDGGPTFRELLARVRETTLGAYQHQDVPFERLVEELAPERSLRHTPVFQVTFAMQNLEAEELRLGGLRLAPLGGGEEAAKFDLTLVMGGGAERLGGMVSFRTELFDARTVERMLEQLRALLETVAADPDRRVAAVPILAPAEREQVLEGLNDTRRDYPAGLRVHDLFAAQARRTPDAPAVSFRGQTVAYADLDARSGRLANHLRRLGVGPETRVGVCLERTPELLVALLAVLRAGGAYVPLDPAYPRERLGYMQEDAGVSLVLTSSVLAGVLPAGTRVLALDAVRAQVESEPTDVPESGVLPENLSHVIFTSGSTGRPKGVMIRHSSTVVLLHWLRENVSDEERASVLFSTSINFDVSVAEIFGTLAWGGKLVMVENALELAGVREPVVYASMVPSAAAELLRMGAIPGSVKTLNLGGEALPADLAQALYALGTVDKVGNLYGPTEDTTYSTYSVVAKGGSQVFVGRPIANTRALVLDAELEPVPLGVVGELYLAGEGLSRGYAGAPELTAERWVPDPFGEPGSRMYRVMDRIRWRPDGQVEYFGRTDFQVKVRGFRIELGEIETALRSHPAVREAVALVREDAPGDRRIVAYVVPAEGAALDAAELRAHLRERVPEYMLPSAHVALDALPQTPNGKTDRRALPAPEAAGADAGAYTAPRTPTEEVLAGIYAEVLGAGRVDTRAGFFDLGGHSLLATRVVSRVGEAFGVELPLLALFEAPSVAELAERVDALLAEGAAVQAPPIVPVPRDGSPLPLSFAQQRLWFIDQLQPGSAAYNIPAALRIRGPLDVAALERTLGAVVARHETLRTVFRAVDGGAVAEILPAGPVAIPVTELAGVAGAEREAAVARAVDAEAARPFDLARGPLLRASLLRLGAAEHVLLFTMHHVVSDGWSMGVLVREVSALYAAFTEGREAALPELPVQYADFAAWQRAWLSGRVLERQLAYWRERLADAPPALELPTDRPVPARPTQRAESRPFRLSAESTARLRALAREEGATPYMALLAGWQALLGRWSGQDDVLVGMPVAGRTRTEVEDLIGFFVNTLVVRADLAGAGSFRGLLGQVRGRVLEAQTHQDVPFEKLVEELHPGRDLRHTPFFRATLSLQAFEGEPLRLGPVTMEPLAGGSGAAKFDLALLAAEGEDGLAGALTFRAELWDAATMDRLLEHFATLLDAAAADPDAPLAALPILPAAERRLVVDAWNDTAAAFPPTPVHALVAEQAARTPDAVAVVAGGERLTYAELDARADGLAAELGALGAGPEARVGIFMERSAEMVVALLAVLRAGAAYVPLDPEYPAERVAYMLADSGAAVLLTQERLRGRLPEFGGVVVAPSPPGPLSPASGRKGENGNDTSLAPLPLAGEGLGRGLAYLIYTSGSTGAPKGVAVPHGALANHVQWMQREFPLGAGDRVLQKTPFSFDASVWEFWAPLVAGATLVMAEPGAHREPARLVRALADEAITVAQFVPSLLGAVLEEDAAAWTAARRVFCGGEALPAELAARCRAALGAEVVNLYGPTEACIDATFAVAADATGATVPIGRAVANARAYVLDREGGPAPVGVPGELYLGGAGLARGYVGRPALTAERWVPDALSGEPGARLYRTGDRVRWLPSGELEWLGRTDFQVKVRGFRIELGEIEAALREHPAVRDAVALVREDAPGDRRIVAYVVAAEGAAADAAELRAHLRTRVAEYMLPSAYVALDALPRTPGGKTDRRALPAPEAAGAGAGGYTAPRTPTEEVLAGIYADVLGAERVDAHADFFDLGGHSLLATRVVARAREALGVDVELGLLFEAPSVAGLAAAVDALLREGAGTEAPPLVPVPRDRELPLSFAQQRLWFIDRLQPGSAAYNIPSALRVRGPLDAGALERALGGLVRRHEALRTTFATVGGRAVQVVHPAGGFVLPRLDLGGRPAAEREAELRRLVDADEAAPFDLSAGPLLRVLLVRLADGEHALLISMHHIVSDAWSMEVMVREVAELYGAFREGRPSPLPELPVQYADYAAWQRAWLVGDVLERQLRWWRERLAGAPPTLELPTDRPRPRIAGTEGSRVLLPVPRDTADALRALARREGATLYMTLMAGWQALLGRHAGQDDVVVGMPVAGRNRAEVERLIGFFVNTLVIRTGLGGAPDARALVRRVRDTVLGAFRHGEIPFERLVEELGVERSLDHTPLYQVVFNLLSAGGAGPGLAGAELEPIETRGGSAKFDLTLTVADDGRELAAALGFRTDLWDAATMERLLGHFARLLAGMAATPDAPVAALPILAPAEREEVLEGLNDTRRDYPAGLRVHDLFAAQARRTPDAPAVSFRGETVAYAELDARSGRLAGHLRRLGVGPETRVGVCLERTPELLVALVAVLRAGGAYVPLDPAYPRERLGWMMEDAGVSLVLTSSRLADVLPAGTRVLALDAVRAEVESEPAAVPESGVMPENLSHVIFTSGSTGRPKGVMIRHSSTVVLLHWLRENVSDEERASVLFSTSINFDVSVAEIFGTLAWGGKLVMVENALELASVREPVVHASMVPTAAAELLRSGGIPASVKTLNLGGEALPADLAQALYALGTVRKVGNLYGPTEDTTYSTYSVVAKGGSQVFVGRPVANTRALVLDAELEPVPLGVVGELYLAGEGLSRGYAGAPELTAERFLPDPFGPAGSRMYRVMDRIRWRPDGELEYFGRTDFQVKVRGFRIELGEIETALRSHPGVQDAAVVVREDTPGSRRLVAYYTAPAGAQPAAVADLRARLREAVPEYMVPSAFVALEALPMTPNGKTDRRALPAPEGRPEGAEEYVAPRTPTEQAVAAIWADLLEVGRVGAHDNFFDLGGHSLLVVQLHARLRELAPALSVADLFGIRTLADLARHLDELRGPEEAAPSTEETLNRADTRRSRLARQRTARAGRPAAGEDDGEDEDV